MRLCAKDSDEAPKRGERTAEEEDCHEEGDQKFGGAGARGASVVAGWVASTLAWNSQGIFSILTVDGTATSLFAIPGWDQDSSVSTGARVCTQIGAGTLQ